jgi:cysteinyl-tRNA synthetase
MTTLSSSSPSPLQDMEALNVERPHAITRVSEHMPEVCNMIQRLHQQGFAYIAEDGSVYFDTGRYRTIAEHPIPTRSRLTLDELDGGETVPHKKHVADFALWKASGEGSEKLRALGAEWLLDLGERTIPGRPGWHIECSAMCSKLFGGELDVHVGGIDLLFPHHCNEVAQSQAFYTSEGQQTPQWPNYFAHVGKNESLCKHRHP